MDPWQRFEQTLKNMFSITCVGEDVEQLELPSIVVEM